MLYTLQKHPVRGFAEHKSYTGVILQPINNRHQPAMAVQSTQLDAAYWVLITLLAEIYSPCDPPSNYNFYLLSDGPVFFAKKYGLSFCILSLIFGSDIMVRIK